MASSGSGDGSITLDTATALSNAATTFLGRLADDNPAVAPAALVAAQVSFQLATANYINSIQAGGDLTSAAFFEKAYIASASLVSAGFTVAAAAVACTGPENEEVTGLLTGVSTVLDDTVSGAKLAQSQGAAANPEFTEPNEDLESKVQEGLDSVDNLINATSSNPVTAVGALISSTLTALKPSDQALSSYADSGQLPSDAGEQGADPLLTTNQNLAPSVTTAYGDSGAPQQNLVETVDGETGVLTGFFGGLTSITTNLDPVNGAAETSLANMADGTSAIFTQNGDGSSLLTDYSGLNGTGAITESDQENADGTSMIVTFDANRNSYSVNFNGPNGTGTASNETLTAGTMAGSQTTIVLPEISVSFPAIRVTPGEGNPQVYYQYLPLEVLSGSVTDEVPTTSSVLQAGQATTYGVPQSFSAGTYAAGTAGSIFVAIDTADLLDEGASLTSLQYANTPLQITLTTPEGSIAAEVLASASIYAAAAPALSDPLDFGNLHVGDQATLDLTVSNTTAAGPLDDTLNVGAISLAIPTSNFTVSGTGNAGLAAGDSETVAVTLNALQQGYGLLNLGEMAFTSHDDALPDETLSSPFTDIKANIYAYAIPQVGISSGPGTVTQNGNNYTIDLGTLEQGSTAPEGTIVGIRNDLPFVTSTQIASDDSLSGSVDTQGASDISLATQGSFSGLNGTGVYPLFYVLPNTSTPGAHTETIIVHTSSDDGFSSTPLPDQVVTIIEDVQAPCFARGTLILTEKGKLPVEVLSVGDQVLTTAGAVETITWIGHRTVACRRHPQPQQVWPIRIVTGAFRLGMPSRDLFLSPDHAVFAEGVLIPVKHLVNGTSIVQVERDEVTYYHVELARHAVLLAEGLPCESYLDNGSRSAFANSGTVAQLLPDFGPAERCEATGEALGYAPLRIAGPEVEQVWARLSRRAAKLGHAMTRTKRKPPTKPIAPSFDLALLLQTNWYLTTNPDVAAAGIDPAVHYAQHGRQEGRMPCPEADLIRGLGLIDAATVIRTMPDVIEAGTDPADHFCAHGWREGRRPNAYFDTAWYRANHVVPAGMNPLVHYILFGEPAGLAPSPHFDPTWYRRHYGLGPIVCALAHYLEHRRTQCFSPRPDFNVRAYVELRAMTMRPDRDPYAHYLVAGRFALDDRGRTAA